MIEMADVAWCAVEYRRERKADAAEDEISHLKAENLRLRTVLADNLAILQSLYKCPPVSKDCPPDLYTRLVAAVDSSSFLTKLESLHQESTDLPNGKPPSSEATGGNLNAVEIMIDVDHGEPSWWVWVTHEIDPNCLEEVSGIDNENYVIISEENVVEGIAHFIARCILENPKSKA
ncbi:putative Dihydrodipicolinate synthase [Cocos nucifera]|nr:putative Dihydrodipicolinate synthase [Cocos nucifera]